MSSTSDEIRRQFAVFPGGNRRGSSSSFSSIPAKNPSTRLLYGPLHSSGSLSRNASISGTDSPPPWIREPSISLDPRVSRASSIISTRTKTSISTDRNDGSESSDEVHGGERHWAGQDGQVVSTRHTDSRPTAFGDTTQRYSDEQLPQSPPRASAEDSASLELRLGQAEPAALDMDMPPSDTVGVSRNPSFTPGKETISVKKHRESGIHSSATSATRTASPGSPGSTPLRRSGGIKLRVVTSTGQSGHGASPISPGSGVSSGVSSPSTSSRLRSAEMEADQEPHSPAYFGKGATGIFPSPAELREITGGFGKVDLGEGKFLRTPDLSPHHIRAKDVSNGRNERHPHTPVSPKHEASQPVLVPKSPVHVDEAVVGVQSPPPMESENDLSIHYSRIVRTLDQAHQKEMRERAEVIRGLARTILDLKTELVRAQHQVRPAKGPATTLYREDTPDAGAFSFPPLKLRHLRTLKRATERRAEKLDKKPSAKSHGGEEGVVSPSVRVDRALDSASGVDVSLNFQTENEGLKGVLVDSQVKIESLELEIRELQRNLELWTKRCQSLELQRKQDHTEHEQNNTVVIERTREEVNTTWEARWRTNHEQLLDRMRRIENDSQRLIKSAAEERDEEWAVTWAKKNAYLLTRLRDKEAEVKELKARKDGGHEAQLKALEKRLAAEEHHSSILQGMLLDLETQHAKTKSELQDWRNKGRAPNQSPSLSPEIGNNAGSLPLPNRGIMDGVGDN
ncbi:MAG: hypothetical protein M1840_007284 [Geoglossum simile]|nr:MAG: hypothetical protein M1840_007284 [Geoglossum simile]